MKGIRTQARLALLAAASWGLAAPAGATCLLAEDKIGSPERIADYLLSTADVVGIGYMEIAAHPEGGAVEAVTIVHPFKGARARYLLDGRYLGDGRRVQGNWSTSLEAEPGELALAVLSFHEGGYVIGECTQVALMAAPVGAIVEAISRAVAEQAESPEPARVR